MIEEKRSLMNCTFEGTGDLSKCAGNICNLMGSLEGRKEIYCRHAGKLLAQNEIVLVI